jgi:hypothetical protein
MRRASKKRMEEDKASCLLRNYKMCLRKVLYWSEIAASCAASRITEQGHPMKVYQCPNCNNWHIASNKEEVVVEKKKKQKQAS